MNYKLCSFSFPCESPSSTAEFLEKTSKLRFTQGDGDRSYWTWIAPGIALVLCSRSKAEETPMPSFFAGNLEEAVSDFRNAGATEVWVPTAVQLKNFTTSPSRLAVVKDPTGFYIGLLEPSAERSASMEPR